MATQRVPADRAAMLFEKARLAKNKRDANTAFVVAPPEMGAAAAAETEPAGGGPLPSVYVPSPHPPPQQRAPLFSSNGPAAAAAPQSSAAGYGPAVAPAPADPALALPFRSAQGPPAPRAVGTTAWAPAAASSGGGVGGAVATAGFPSRTAPFGASGLDVYGSGPKVQQSTGAGEWPVRPYEYSAPPSGSVAGSAVAPGRVPVSFERGAAAANGQTQPAPPLGRPAHLAPSPPPPAAPAPPFVALFGPTVSVGAPAPAPAPAAPPVPSPLGQVPRVSATHGGGPEPPAAGAAASRGQPTTATRPEKRLSRDDSTPVLSTGGAVPRHRDPARGAAAPVLPAGPPARRAVPADSSTPARSPSDSPTGPAADPVPFPSLAELSAVAGDGGPRPGLGQVVPADDAAGSSWTPEAWAVRLGLVSVLAELEVNARQLDCALEDRHKATERVEALLSRVEARVCSDEAAAAEGAPDPREVAAENRRLKAELTRAWEREVSLRAAQAAFADQLREREVLEKKMREEFAALHDGLRDSLEMATHALETERRRMQEERDVLLAELRRQLDEATARRSPETNGTPVAQNAARSLPAVNRPPDAAAAPDGEAAATAPAVLVANKTVAQPPRSAPSGLIARLTSWAVADDDHATGWLW